MPRAAAPAAPAPRAGRPPGPAPPCRPPGCPRRCGPAPPPPADGFEGILMYVRAACLHSAAARVVGRFARAPRWRKLTPADEMPGTKFVGSVVEVTVRFRSRMGKIAACSVCSRRSWKGDLLSSILGAANAVALQKDTARTTAVACESPSPQSRPLPSCNACRVHRQTKASAVGRGREAGVHRTS
jgi:hypothetical protein